MTYEQIVERIENILKAASEMAEATKIYPKSLFEGIYPEILEFINRQQEQLEAAIAGQETLQKALAEKNTEIERRKNNLFCKVVIDEEEMRNIVNKKVAEFELDIELIKAEAIKECIEKTQAFLAIKCRGVVEDNPNLDEILWGYRKEDVDEFFDNLVKEMVGDAE